MDPPCSSRLLLRADSRFPVAGLSRSVSIGFPRAGLLLRVVTGSDEVPGLSE